MKKLMLDTTAKKDPGVWCSRPLTPKSSTFPMTPSCSHPFAYLWACQSPCDSTEPNWSSKLWSSYLSGNGGGGRGTSKYQRKGGTGGSPQLCLSFYRKKSIPWKPLLHTWMSLATGREGRDGTLNHRLESSSKKSRGRKEPWFFSEPCVPGASHSSSHRLLTSTMR